MREYSEFPGDAHGCTKLFGKAGPIILWFEWPKNGLLGGMANRAAAAAEPDRMLSIENGLLTAAAAADEADVDGMDGADIDEPAIAPRQERSWRRLAEADERRRATALNSFRPLIRGGDAINRRRRYPFSRRRRRPAARPMGESADYRTPASDHASYSQTSIGVDVAGLTTRAHLVRRVESWR
uniref:Uncharacterized protein n=1 Tax=Plectus sambesii TaxID=2011161 RepID=A0A914VRD6_9BILA